MDAVCPKCNAGFTCSADLPGDCWCTSYPPILEIDENIKGCYCQNCLEIEMKSAIEKYVSEVKSGKRQNEAPKYSNPAAGVKEGIDYYMDKGLFVFTEWFHLKRGNCCGNACRHCPYNHINVR